MTILSLIKNAMTPMFVMENQHSQSKITPLTNHPLFASTEPGIQMLPGQELATLLPKLGRITRQRKWVIMVSPPTTLTAQQLAQSGIDSRRYLVINARSSEGKWWAVEQALRSGNCGAVLCWADHLGRQQNRRLEQAALEGGAQCICLQDAAPLPPQPLLSRAA
jgi:cell division inhibitor SulA